jgi:hypothetical protein
MIGRITYPEIFVFMAHLAGAFISVWMSRWDLLAAGIAFGIPSTLLFHDLSPNGRGVMIALIKKIL